MVAEAVEEVLTTALEPGGHVGLVAGGYPDAREFFQHAQAHPGIARVRPLGRGGRGDR